VTAFLFNLNPMECLHPAAPAAEPSRHARASPASLCAISSRPAGPPRSRSRAAESSEGA